MIKFLSRIGRHGTADLRFRSLYGLTINQTNGDIAFRFFQRISNSFLSFGEDSLSNPRDIKLSKDYIYVLDGSNPFVYLFDYDHVLQKRHVTRANEMLVSNPSYFSIDDSNNLVISDYIVYFVLK